MRLRESFALENNIQRLEEDHLNAALLGQQLAKIPQLDVDLDFLHTNMVFFKAKEGNLAGLSSHLEQKEILIDAEATARIVCHLDISREDILLTIAAIEEYSHLGWARSCLS